MTAPAIEVEVTELDESALAGSPPCDMISKWRWRWSHRKRCGRPATHRVKIRCPAHGERLRFLCRWHLAVLRQGVVRCETCDDSPVEYLGES